MLIFHGDELPFGAACFLLLTIKRRLRGSLSHTCILHAGKAEVLCPIGLAERFILFFLISVLEHWWIMFLYCINMY